MRLPTLTAALIALPALAFAVGSDDDTPPTPTDTTKTCENGQVWDADSQNCVAPKDARLNDADRLKAVRELAYAGRLNDAQTVLDAMQDQQADGVLTYRGFVARASGRAEDARVWYARALAQNPDNLLARSYMGQGFAEAGDIVAARAQLREIRQRGGRNSWPEFALRQAIETGQGYAF